MSERVFLRLISESGEISGPESAAGAIGRKTPVCVVIESSNVNSPDVLRQLGQAADGDEAAWSCLLDEHREHLRRMVQLRMDQRMRGRVDASDVIQEALLAAWSELPGYILNQRAPFGLWLRSIAGNKLLELHRRHLGTEMRDARREISLFRPSPSGALSEALAARLVGSDSRPSRAAVRIENKARLKLALDRLDQTDREVLALRHFEQLSNEESAHLLGIAESAASKRYLRALVRLRSILSSGGEGQV